MNSELTKPEISTLADCERVIEAGQRTFVEVGQALLQIRESRLYRAEHDTFEAYCLSRWGWTHGRARQLIDAASTAANLKSDTVVSPPSSERVVRPLTKLEPAQQREAWTKANENAAAEDRPVTARDVTEVVVEIEPPVVRRRSPERFDINEWERHTATMLDLRFRGVPVSQLERAEEIIVAISRKYVERLRERRSA